ncbi:MAG: dihydroorotate dehydrogenase-like protein [Anaerolineae bacterium]|nr:dihydroorotate dehydrogenase-like protein [Anaerolineae bacterium]
MVDLKTTYLGVELKNPLVVAASSVSSYIDRVKMAEDAGAGALIIRSLFEEQIQLDAMKLDNMLSTGGNSYAEATSYFPDIEHGGADEHLMWVEKTRKAVSMPVFASLNAVSPGAWTAYAKQLADTGVAGLEVNFYQVPTDPTKSGSEIEQQLYDVVAGVQAAVDIPVSVKLSPFYTSPGNVVKELEQRGVKGVVLFNRFLQPDIDPETESLFNEMVLSKSIEMKLPLRWVALLYGRVGLDLALNTGVHTGRDLVKGLLAGATVVQVASTLLQNGIPYLSTMLLDLQNWMDEKGYDSVDDFRGTMSQKKVADPFTFERAQYVQLLSSLQ